MFMLKHSLNSDATLNQNKQPLNSKPFYTTAEVCSLLSVHRTTVAYWRKKGYINAYAVKNSRRVLFKSSEIDSLITKL